MSMQSLQEPYSRARAGESVIVFADGGARLQAPCNTLPAMELALRQGAGGLKLDIQLTRDHVPVVCRDDVFVEADEASVPVASLTMDRIQEIDVGTRFSLRFRDTHIPGLDEVLSTFGSDTLLHLELHLSGHRLPHLASLVASGAAAMVWKKMVDPFVSAVVRSVHFHRCAERVVLSSANPFLLEGIERHDPSIRRAWLPKPGQFRLPDSGTYAGAWHELVLNPREVRSSDIARLVRAGVPVSAGPVSDPAFALELVAAGVGAVITDEPWKVSKALMNYQPSLQRA